MPGALAYVSAVTHRQRSLQLWPRLEGQQMEKPSLAGFPHSHKEAEVPPAPPRELAAPMFLSLFFLLYAEQKH